MADGLEPVGLAMVVCDAIHHDPYTGKRTLLGTFLTFFSKEFPAIVPMMGVYVVITECRGTFPIALRIVDSNEERPPLANLEGEVNFNDPLAPLEIDFRLFGTQFPMPGEYHVQFLAAGALIMERRLLVGQTQQGETPS